MYGSSKFVIVVESFNAKTGLGSKVRSRPFLRTAGQDRLRRWAPGSSSAACTPSLPGSGPTRSVGLLDHVSFRLHRSAGGLRWSYGAGERA
jgi:hypothetical protein